MGTSKRPCLALWWLIHSSSALDADLVWDLKGQLRRALKVGFKKKGPFVQSFSLQDELLLTALRFNLERNSDFYIYPLIVLCWQVSMPWSRFITSPLHKPQHTAPNYCSFVIDCVQCNCFTAACRKNIWLPIYHYCSCGMCIRGEE